MSVNCNVLEDSWIPVQDLDTGDVVYVGARQALVQAHRWRLAESDGDASYPVVFKFLLALWAASGAAPDSDAGWRAAWDAPRVPADVIGAYCDKWRDRFFMLDEAYPFMQCPDLDMATRDASTLRSGYFTSNSGRDYDFDGEAARSTWTVSEAVVPLLRAHAIDTAGIKTGLPGNTKGKTYGAKLGLLGATTQVLAHGRNLKDDLLLCLPPYARTEGDAPAWERDTATAGVDTRNPSGMLDVLTWRSRSIRIFADDGGVVSGVAWHDGDRVAADVDLAALDPCSAWRRNTDSETARAYFCDVDSGMPGAAKFVLSVVPWRARDFGLDLGDKPLDSTSSTAASAGVVDHLVTMSDTVGRVPVSLQFHSVAYGTKAAIVDDVNFLDVPGNGLPMGSGRVWADPARRAIMGIAAGWARRAHAIAHNSLKSADNHVVRVIADKVPDVVLCRDRWGDLVRALDSDDASAWREAAVAVMHSSSESVLSFLKGEMAARLKYVKYFQPAHAHVYSVWRKWKQAVGELCDRHVPASVAQGDSDLPPVWFHTGDAVGETRRRRGIALSQLGAGVGESILGDITSGVTIGTAAATYRLTPQALNAIATWNMEWRDALDEALTAGRDPDIPHGPNSYRMYGCRCPQCRHAHHSRRNP